ncbi:MAG: hypothetical protein M3024_12955 [Candidatus Dormibacteraeota bacterium]|nr:hypothetical protein [Candidatus Dormibacteraeota bacterium]
MNANAETELRDLQAGMAAELSAHLDQHLERLTWGADRIASYQRHRLRVLLAHAAEHSRFHARRLRGLDIGRFELADLARLPTMTKAEMMAGFDELVTDSRLGRDIVEQHLAASETEPRLLCGEYVCLASGGSSGLRGIFVQTVAEYTDFVASVVRSGWTRMIAGGGPPPGGLVIGLVGAASPVHSSGFGAAVSGPPVQMIAAPATLPLQEIVRRLNAAQPPALLGYPSKLAELAGEQQEGRLRIAPRSVTAMSELLTAEARALIGDAFGVAVVDQFVSTEGLAGQSEPHGSVFEFASDLCLVELVDANNQPVPEGVRSEKALVTNLHNLTQPLVRYELTDRFIGRPGTPGHGHLRASVEGRADEVFRFGGIEVYPHVLRSVLTTTAAVREYQVRQTERGIDVACVSVGRVDQPALAAQLARALSRAGVAEPRVDVRLVGEVVRDPKSGKTRRFIPRQPPPSGPPAVAEVVR